MAMQILHYEFLGPVAIAEWGPPMIDVVYVMLARKDDKFSVVYAGQCSRSEDVGFFVKNPSFKCWMQHAGSERNLHVAVRQMPGSSAQERGRIVEKIVAKYAPACGGSASEPEPEPEPEPAEPEAPVCACCGTKMELEKAMERGGLYRCGTCNLSETRLS